MCPSRIINSSYMASCCKMCMRWIVISVAKFWMLSDVTRCLSLSHWIWYGTILLKYFVSKNVYTILDIIVTETSKKILIVINLFNLSLNYSVIENLENFVKRKKWIIHFWKSPLIWWHTYEKRWPALLRQTDKNNATASNIH